MSNPTDKLLTKTRQAPTGVRFVDAIKVAEHFFGAARHKGSSHILFKTPCAMGVENGKSSCARRPRIGVW